MITLLVGADGKHVASLPFYFVYVPVSFSLCDDHPVGLALGKHFYGIDACFVRGMCDR